MSKSRYIKKYSLKHQYLKLELEDINDICESHLEDWNKRFGKYFVKDKEMLINTETGELKDPEEIEKAPKSKKHNKVKKLFRELSKRLHPDKGGKEKDFLSAKKAYESNDMLELLELAGLNDVKFDIEEEDEELLEGSIKSLSKQIEVQKLSMIYTFYTGDILAKRHVVSQLETMCETKIDKKDLPEEMLEN